MRDVPVVKETSVEIRYAKTDDTQFLAAMIAELFGIEADFVPQPEKHQAGLLALMAKPKEAAVFVAQSAKTGEIIGMVTVQLTVSTAQGGPSGLLEDLFVREEWRRSGVASALVEAVERWCRERGAGRVQLLMDTTNDRALRFYEARGFESTRMVCRRKFID